MSNLSPDSGGSRSMWLFTCSNKIENKHAYQFNNTSLIYMQGNLYSYILINSSHIFKHMGPHTHTTAKLQPNTPTHYVWTVSPTDQTHVDSLTCDLSAYDYSSSSDCWLSLCTATYTHYSPLAMYFLNQLIFFFNLYLSKRWFTHKANCFLCFIFTQLHTVSCWCYLAQNDVIA